MTLDDQINGIHALWLHTHTHTPRAALAAAAATLGSTTDARKATVLMTGFPDWLKGTGW